MCQALTGHPHTQDAPPQAGNAVVIAMVVYLSAHFAHVGAIPDRVDKFNIRVEVSAVEPPLPFAGQQAARVETLPQNCFIEGFG